MHGIYSTITWSLRFQPRQSLPRTRTCCSINVVVSATRPQPRTCSRTSERHLVTRVWLHSLIPASTTQSVVGNVAAHCTAQLVDQAVADCPLGRVGSCLRPGMVRRPVISAKCRFFRHHFRVCDIQCEKKREKNVLLKHFVHSFINSKHSMFRFYARSSCLCKTA